MPPHCDTMDGPVVKAARMALDNGNVKLILPYAPEKTEDEIKKIFERTLAARRLGGPAAEVAERWFFETVVRLHREGEGAPFTGLKPAGLDPGPVVPKAERAIEKGNPKEVIEFLTHAVQGELQDKFKRIMALRDYDPNDVGAAREYVEAMLGFELYSHHLYTSIKGGAHGEQAASHEH